MFRVLLSFIGPWLLWRLVTFSVLPWFQPNAPKELPYWIPVLGHARAFIKDSQSLIERGKEYFGDNGEPFTITVGGKKLYILTTPEDVASVYRNNVTLSWDAMLNNLLVGFGVRASVIDQIWTKLPLSTLQHSRPDLDINKVPHLSCAHSTLDLYKRQLLPGPKFDVFNDTLLGYISRSMTWTHVSAEFSLKEDSRLENVSLRDLCSNILVDAVTRTLYGDCIYDIEPQMTEHLLNFNEDAWMLVFQYPHGKNSRLSKARAKLLEAFVKYSQRTDEGRAGQSWLIKASMEEQKALDVNDQDRAALLLMIYWAANINPYKLAFWMLSYILFNDTLLKRLKDETNPATRGCQVDLQYLMNNCPLLESVYQETLRIVNGALSARKIIAPTHIGGKTLQSPHTILIAFRQLQYNKKVFGDDPTRFEPERFLKDKSLGNSPSFRPFGGGVNYCPGRFLAKQEMFTFVALALKRFNISLTRSQPQIFPELDTSTPALGINSSKDEMDVFIDLDRISETPL